MSLPPIYFLSGLPRTGSTLLGSIMNQNPTLHVTPTSPLYTLLEKLSEAFAYCNDQHTYDHERISEAAYRSLVGTFYANEFRTVFDKHRGWPQRIDTIKQFINPSPKLIATIRPIAEIVASYLVLIEKDENNFVDNHLKQLGCKTITNEDRANLLWQFYLKTPYDSLLHGLKANSESIMLVDYEDIVFRPHQTLRDIYAFCNLPPFRHSMYELSRTGHQERDDQWGLKNLHAIRDTLEYRSVPPSDLLPRAAIEYFAQFDVRRCAYA